MEPMLQFFHYDHLPTHLREVSRPFCDLAHEVVRNLPRNPERTVALRKLLEAKDAAVRSVIYIAPEAPPSAEDFRQATAGTVPEPRPIGKATTRAEHLKKAVSIEDVITPVPRCTHILPGGDQCVLPTGHEGSHSL